MSNMYKQIEAVLPAEVISLVHTLRDDISNQSWILGDMVNLIYHHVRLSHLNYRKIHCAAWVSRNLDSGNHAAQTLQFYSQVAQAFPDGDESLRRKYSGVLPFSHFEVAKVAEDPAAVLKFSIDYAAENYGRYLSAPSLRLGFTTDPDGHETLDPSELPHAHYEQEPYPAAGEFVADKGADKLARLAWSVSIALGQLVSELETQDTCDSERRFMLRTLGIVQSISERFGVSLELEISE